MGMGPERAVGVCGGMCQFDVTCVGNVTQGPGRFKMAFAARRGASRTRFSAVRVRLTRAAAVSNLRAWKCIVHPRSRRRLFDKPSKAGGFLTRKTLFERRCRCGKSVSGPGRRYSQRSTTPKLILPLGGTPTTPTRRFPLSPTN